MGRHRRVVDQPGLGLVRGRAAGDDRRAPDPSTATSKARRPCSASSGPSPRRAAPAVVGHQRSSPRRRGASGCCSSLLGSSVRHRRRVPARPRQPGSRAGAVADAHPALLPDGLRRRGAGRGLLARGLVLLGPVGQARAQRRAVLPERQRAGAAPAPSPVSGAGASVSPTTPRRTRPAAVAVVLIGEASGLRAGRRSASTATAAAPAPAAPRVHGVQIDHRSAVEQPGGDPLCQQLLRAGSVSARPARPAAAQGPATTRACSPTRPEPCLEARSNRSSELRASVPGHCFVRLPGSRVLRQPTFSSKGYHVGPMNPRAYPTLAKTRSATARPASRRP